MRRTCWWTGSGWFRTSTCWCGEMLSWSTCECTGVRTAFPNSRAVDFTICVCVCVCVYTDRTKQNYFEERQADVEYELRCLLNKPGKRSCRLQLLQLCDNAVFMESSGMTSLSCPGPSESEWSKDDRNQEHQLMDELVTVIEQRNQIINSLEQDRQR